jgi:hypothetical protein
MVPPNVVAANTTMIRVFSLQTQGAASPECFAHAESARVPCLVLAICHRSLRCRSPSRIILFANEDGSPFPFVPSLPVSLSCCCADGLEQGEYVQDTAASEKLAGSAVCYDAANNLIWCESCLTACVLEWAVPHRCCFAPHAHECGCRAFALHSHATYCVP